MYNGKKRIEMENLQINLMKNKTKADEQGENLYNDSDYYAWDFYVLLNVSSVRCSGTTKRQHQECRYLKDWPKRLPHYHLLLLSLLQAYKFDIQ